MLHAQQLGFDHPQTGNHLEFSAPLPLDMERILAQLKNPKIVLTDADYSPV